MQIFLPSRCNVFVRPIFVSKISNKMVFRRIKRSVNVNGQAPGTVTTDVRSWKGQTQQGWALRNQPAENHVQKNKRQDRKDGIANLQAAKSAQERGKESKNRGQWERGRSLPVCRSLEKKKKKRKKVNTT